jgi:hypothetical protein
MEEKQRSCDIKGLDPRPVRATASSPVNAILNFVILGSKGGLGRI